MIEVDTRYYRWRNAITKPFWMIDRHWYGLLGALYLLDHPSQREAQG